ncbi:MAG: S1C family serine protease [bacterium]
MLRGFSKSTFLAVSLLALAFGTSVSLHAQMTPQERLIVEIYERVSPAVVNITSRVITQDFFLGEVPREGAGSGFVIDRRGYIVTNNHVVEGAEELEVTFSDETVVAARVVGVDPSVDLAVIKVDFLPEGLSPVELGDSSSLQPGQLAIAIGNPFGLGRTITTGVISALNRTLRARNNRVIGGVVQTDAAINPGNSGGPLLDSQGRLIGVNTAIFSPTGGSVGVGFAIPVDTVKRVVPELISRGRYAHPWLGISGISITPELSNRLARAGIPLGVKRGILVASVLRGGPADHAGLRGGTREMRLGNRMLIVGGDVITSIDGNPLKGMEDLSAYLEMQTKVGQKVNLSVLRGGREQTISVTLGERPSDQ